MNNVIGQIFPSTQFTWSKETRTLVAEISSVPGVLRQLWNDSFDLGFGIRSHKTGNVAYFTLVDQVKDGESDIVMWVFEAHIRSIQDNQGLRGVRVNVYNT